MQAWGKFAFIKFSSLIFIKSGSNLCIILFLLIVCRNNVLNYYFWQFVKFAYGSVELEDVDEYYEDELHDNI